MTIGEVTHKYERRRLKGRRQPKKSPCRVPQSSFDDLSDDCLSCVFGFLGSNDRNSCSLVCRRWLPVEGPGRHHFFLRDSKDKPESDDDDFLTIIPSLFARFNAVTTIYIVCSDIRDDALAPISIHCPYLTCLKLDACMELTDAGMAAFAVNCRGLKEFYCEFCDFGVKGINAIVDHCSLEVLSVVCLMGPDYFGDHNNDCRSIGPGVASYSLKTISIEDLDCGCQYFGQLIAASKNLRTLNISKCPGKWDKVFEEAMKSKISSLVEIHLQNLPGVSDATLVAISKACLDLEILCLIEITPKCTDAGLISVADHCKLLRELHIWRWHPKPSRRYYTLGSDKGLSAIAKGCLNLRVLFFYGCNPTSLSLGLLAANCQNLERLALCYSSRIGDAEISSIAAAKCTALRRLGIMRCSGVTHQGIKVLSGGGCPNLVKLVIRYCKGVTNESIDQLKADRGSLSVSTEADPFWDTVRNHFKGHYINFL